MLLGLWATLREWSRYANALKQGNYWDLKLATIFWILSDVISP
ncbi:hypothetical protein [Moorena sp. SIO3I6]|nr:hypothetical protein [Moorena sp. SIO3I6]